MEEGSKGKTAVVILGIVFVVAFGIGGYFLGQYFDTKNFIKEQEAAGALKDTYTNEALGITLEVPSNVNVYEGNFDTGEDDVESNGFYIELESGSKVEFELYEGESKLDGYLGECTVDDTDCTFVTMENGSKYGRFLNPEDDDPTEDGGEIWYIAEETIDSEGDKYYYYSPVNGFTFFVKNDSDISVLDGIMKTLERS